MITTGKIPWPAGATTVLWDLDSTLADTRHRREHIPPRDQWSNNLAWEKYSLACADDTVIPGARNLFQMLGRSYCRTIVLTGRLDVALEPTKKWLEENDLAYKKVHLLMRPTERSDLRPEEWKRGVVQGLLDEGHVIRLAVDDHPATAVMFAGLGIPTLVVRPPTDDYADMAHL